MRIDTEEQSFVLALTCPDQPGIVHAVSEFFLRHGGDISESQQYGDASTSRFFMRVEVILDPSAPPLDVLKTEFAIVADEWEMDFVLSPTGHRLRTAILVSRLGHCLNDLLYRWRSAQLNIDVVLVISNHRDLEALAEANGVPFLHIPVLPGAKADAEAELLRALRAADVELVVLARYMQILSDDLCRHLAGHAINIHHSFLPSFKGAKPYHQAQDRGVKLVGATAHYVTAALDEGPIIEQDVHRVDHRADPAALVIAGQDAERLVLARAVRWHAERRVFTNEHRTVVFN